MNEIVIDPILQQLMIELHNMTLALKMPKHRNNTDHSEGKASFLGNLFLYDVRSV